MAKGYPTREAAPEAPVVELPTGACIICKRRPAARAGVCATCEAALAGR